MDDLGAEILARDHGEGKRMRNLSTRIEDDLYDRVRAASQADGRTMASWVRRVLIERLRGGKTTLENGL